MQTCSAWSVIISCQFNAFSRGFIINERERGREKLSSAFVSYDTSFSLLLINYADRRQTETYNCRKPHLGSSYTYPIVYLIEREVRIGPAASINTDRLTCLECEIRFSAFFVSLTTAGSTTEIVIRAAALFPRANKAFVLERIVPTPSQRTDVSLPNRLAGN